MFSTKTVVDLHLFYIFTWITWFADDIVYLSQIFHPLLVDECFIFSILRVLYIQLDKKKKKNQ